jgi:hypothetical protein
MTILPRCDYSLSDGLLSLDFGLFSVKDAAIGITVLLGEDEVPNDIYFGEADSETEYVQNTPAGTACCTKYCFTDEGGFGFDYVIGKLQDCAGVFLTATFHNNSPDPVRLRSVYLLKTDKDGVKIEGDYSEWTLMAPQQAAEAADLTFVHKSRNERTKAFLEGVGWPLPESFPEDEKSNDGHWRSCSDYVTLYTDQGQRGIAMGAVGVTADVAFDWWIADTCGLEVICQMSDILVDPGESRDSETVAFICGPYDMALPKIIRWTAANAGSRTHLKEPNGWCSWYWIYNKVTAEEVLGLAKAGLKYEDRLHFQNIQIDDGNQWQAGNWDYNDTFPDGIAPFIHAVKKADATPGIWLAPQAVHNQVGGPHYTCESGPIHDVHPDWFQRKADGSLENESIFWGDKSSWIDPTHPGAMTFMRRIMRRKYEEGFRYFKIDFNYLSAETRWYNPKKTRLQAFRDLYRMFREEIGEDSYQMASTIGISRGPLGFADSVRIGPDSCPMWDAPNPCCIREALRVTGATAHFNQIWYTNDPDVTYTMPIDKLTMEELHTWHSMVGLLGGAIFISDPFHHPEYQNEDAFRMWEILTPQAPEKAVSLHPGMDLNHRRFGFIAHRAWQDFASVLLYNPDEGAADVSLDFPGISALGEKFHAWSFWDGKYLGVIDRSYVAQQLPSHSCVLLRLTAVENGPTLVGSDLHISMGASEVDSMRKTDDSLIIDLNSGGATNGSLYVVSEMPLSIESFVGMDEASICQEENLLWRISLNGRKRDIEQNLVLKF